MNARITLTATGGPLCGQRFVFPMRMVIAVGRAPDCALRIRGESTDLTLSRRHCLLDIDPPAVRVRDLGSLNGTFVNGSKIAQRDRTNRPGEGEPTDPEGVELHDGDWLLVGGSEFRVGVWTSPDEEPEGTEAPCGAEEMACSC